MSCRIHVRYPGPNSAHLALQAAITLALAGHVDEARLELWTAAKDGADPETVRQLGAMLVPSKSNRDGLEVLAARLTLH